MTTLADTLGDAHEAVAQEIADLVTGRAMPTDDIPEAYRAPKPLGARRLDHARSFIRRFWIPASDAALDLVILWAAATHFTGEDRRLLFESFPRLYFGSKTPQSGKSTILRLLAGPVSGVQDGLCARGEWVSDPTAPAMRNLLHAEASSLLLDESDTKQGSGAFPAEMRNILLAGYTIPAFVPRGKSGNANGADRYRVDGPVALGGMWDAFLAHRELRAVRERTIMIPCIKPPENVEAEIFRMRDHGDALTAHGMALADWASMVKYDAAKSRPRLDGFAKRDHQLIEPILMVADAAGGDWPERARRALKTVMRGFPDEGAEFKPTNPFELLIHDLSKVWHSDEERLPSREIVKRLQALPGSGWKRYEDHKAAGKDIAMILDPEGVEPKVMRISPEDAERYGTPETVRGYTLTEMMRLGVKPQPPQYDEDDDDLW